MTSPVTSPCDGRTDNLDFVTDTSPHWTFSMSDAIHYIGFVPLRLPSLLIYILIYKCSGYITSDLVVVALLFGSVSVLVCSVSASI